MSLTTSDILFQLFIQMRTVFVFLSIQIIDTVITESQSSDTVGDQGFCFFANIGFRIPGTLKKVLGVGMADVIY